ncbi:hypothetical protein RclHR1_10550001 [Rhizophagus clarus]|uniref:Reverse transcriptase domain-containing protein n=1 Tax=Rhizophagus clarus TaxID=94130 RepID=A0A2Z6QGF5_9GLOM|nr:hypothetical protein RclHR1_10550001 [Rhizophagus clarus]
MSSHTSQNVARRGGGLPNTNSRRAHRHNKRNNNNNSDNSSSDGESTAQQKCTRTLSASTMDEDFVADTAADVGVDSLSSPPKENNTVSTSLSSPPNRAAASSAPSNDASTSLNANDYQAAAAPNSAPETLKNFPTNKALIDAVNNTFLEMYKSYTGKARMTGSGDFKRLVIHFQTMAAHDACVDAAHQQFPDLVFHAHNPRQLRSNEDLRAIQVTDIPFFLTKENVISYFKKFGNIASCRVYSRNNAKVQQARIVYDSAQSIARFDSQWAVYCFSTCLRVTPCHYTVDQKSSRRAFVTTLTQLPPNTKDIDLAPLIRELGAKAVNIPLSLNSYKSKRWAYITFPSQELMDAAMEQLISYQGHTLQWNLPDNTNKLYHRCGKLGCAPNQCPLRQQRGRTRDRNPVAALKERFHVGQPSRPKTTSRSRSHSRSRSKGPDNSRPSQHQQSASTQSKVNIPNNQRNRSKSNDKRDRSVSFSFALCTPPLSSTCNQPHSLSPQDASEILSLLKALQQDMADVRDRITALELNDQHMTRIERHIGLQPLSSVPPTAPQSSDMNIDQPDISRPSLAQDSSLSMSHSRPLNPLLPDFVPSTSYVVPANTSSSAVITPSAPILSPKHASAEIQAINEKHSAIESKMDMLVASIGSFIGSINTSTTSNLADTANNNFNYDSFVRNPPNPVDIENISLQDSLFSSISLSPPLSNSFNISSFNINGLKMHSQNKIEQLNNFFSLKHISFGGVIDTHLHPKQMQFLSKRLSNYTVFSSSLDTSLHIRSSGGVWLFIKNSLAPHVHTYTSHSSRLLSIDLYFKGNIKLRIFVVYIPPTSDQALRDTTIDLLIQALSDTKRLGFHHAICGNFNMHLDQFYPIFFNQPQIASKRIHRLFNFLLSSGYVDFTPINFSDSLGTFHRADVITCIDYIWSCPLLKSFLLSSIISDACDHSLSDHNPVITYFDSSLLSSSVKLARARQLKRRSRRIFLLDSVSPALWDDFSAHIDASCTVPPNTFASWHINRMCEYLHSSIIAGATAVLPSRMIGNDHTPKLPKELETLIQHYRFLNRVLHSIRLLRKYSHSFSSSHDRKWTVYRIRLENIFRLYKSCFTTVPVLPPTLSSCRANNFQHIFDILTHSSSSLRGLHLLKEKEYQDLSIKSHIEKRDLNFDTDISSFINSALSRSRQRIVLDRVFIDHPTAPHLLTDPLDISDAVVNHFQHAVPIKSTPPVHISALPDRWRSEYSPMDSISPAIYDSLLSPPSLEEWLSTISSMPNGKTPGPSMITYEMLKHLGPAANALLLALIRKCFTSADIPDLWRQAMVFPIPKPHEWRCQLQNTRPITLLEVIQKSFVKLLYNRLSSILAAHNVLTGGNFAGLPGGTCRDPIITLESIIHNANCTNSPLWILSQNISKAFDSVHLTMLKFALERICLPASSIQLILSLFMSRSNRVFTAHGDTPSYQVRIGIDQGEVISPLLWVIYINPLLSVLKKEMLDPYILRSPSLLPTSLDDSSHLLINNLVFIDDSTLISSSKSGLEHMLSITEEFYALNNTSANHHKYVLISNSLPLTTTSNISPVDFNLSLSSLNRISSISVTPISITSSFRFLGVWFNIKGSRDFVKKQIANECNSFAATLHLLN